MAIPSWRAAPAGAGRFASPSWWLLLLSFWSRLGRRFGAVQVGLGLCVGWTLAPGATFTATLDRDTVTVGESITLSLVFEGGEPESAPPMPSIQNVRIQYRGPARQFTIVNGRTSSTYTLTYLLTPAQPGDYTVPALRAQVGGRTLTSQPLKFRALKPGTGAGDTDLTSRLAFLRLAVPKTNLYVGEVIPVEIRLYVYDAENVQNPQLTAEGWTFGALSEPVRQRVQVGNAIYHLLLFRLAAMPAKSGTLTLGPAECQLVLKVPVQGRRRSNDPFDLFDDDFFGFFGPRYQRVPKTLYSEAHSVRVQPLPTQNVPESFTGAVGQYTFSASASPTNVAVGDPITLRFEISGRGSLDNLTLPPLNLPDFQTYPPTSQVKTTDELGIEGVKTFEQIVIPQSPAVRALPAWSFSFFDPEQQRYVELEQPAMPLVVRPAAAAPAAPTVIAGTSQPATPPPPQDIVHIKTRPGRLLAVGAPLLARPWFLSLQAVPLLAFLSALLWRRWQDTLANDPRLRRRRQVRAMLKAGLRELPALAQAEQGEAFFATVFRLLQEQIGERLGLPASSITEEIIETRLRPAGLAPEAAGLLRELFQTCNQARYAPPQSTQELLSLVPIVEAAFRALQDFEPTA